MSGKDDYISRRDAIEEISEYATIWMSYTDDMSASDIAQEAINSAKDTMIRILKEQPTVQPDLSGYSSRLWENAYERGKAEAEADKDELLKILKMAKFEYEEAWRIITHPTPDVNYADKNRAQVILDTFRDSLGKMQCTEVRVKDDA